MDLTVTSDNRILIGKSKKQSDGSIKWIGEPEDITNKAVQAVFEYMFKKSHKYGFNHGITIICHASFSFCV